MDSHVSYLCDHFHCVCVLDSVWVHFLKIYIFSAFISWIVSKLYLCKNIFLYIFLHLSEKSIKLLLIKKKIIDPKILNDWNDEWTWIKNPTFRVKAQVVFFVTFMHTLHQHPAEILSAAGVGRGGTLLGKNYRF